MHKNSLEIRKAAKNLNLKEFSKKSQNLTKVEKIRQNVFTFRISLQFDDFFDNKKKQNSNFARK